MYCINCGNKLNSKDNYCSKCGNKIENNTNEVEKDSDIIDNTVNSENNNTDILPLLLGIASILTIFLLPLSISLAIASIILGNKNNREDPEHKSNAPIILGTISLIISTIIIIISIFISIFLIKNRNNIDNYIHNNWNSIVEESPKIKQEKEFTF